MPQLRSGSLLIDYSVAHRAVRYPRVEMKTGKLVLVLPNDYEEEKNLVEKHKNWIVSRAKDIGLALNRSKTKKLNTKRDLHDLKRIVFSELKECESLLGKTHKSVQFKTMNSKWGSCSSASCLTLNSLLRFLPERLIRYVAFHESVHLLERKHNSRFWALVNKAYPEHNRLEKELFIYWFLVQKKRA